MKKCANPKCNKIIPLSAEKYSIRTFCSKRCKNRVTSLAGYWRKREQEKLEALKNAPSDKTLETKLIEYFKENGWD